MLYNGRDTMAMLKTQGRSIMNGNQAITLKGFNLGSLFPMEYFMCPMSEGALGGANGDTYSIMQKLQQRFGKDTMRSLMQAYQEAWITSSDFDNIKNAGFNLVRIPVWWGQFFDLDNPTVSGWHSDAFKMLDRVVDMAEQRHIYVIIDMHGAIGSQSLNASTGRKDNNTYWSTASAQTDTAWMWWQIANRYKNHTYVAGYDLLNEPDPRPSESAGWDDSYRRQILTEYRRLYKAVRDADANHIIFIENTFWNWNWDMLPDPRQEGWSNVVYESHIYQWPAEESSAHAQKVRQGVDDAVKDYKNHSAWNVPCYIGEFNPLSKDASLWRYMIEHFNQAGMHWSIWAYKSSNSEVPNFWGWYDRKGWVGQPDIANDSAQAIAEKWQRWTTSNAFQRNDAASIRPN